MIQKLKFVNNNSLEEYRFKSLFTKEPETIFWIKKIKKNEVLIDVGANIGIYSLFAGKNNIKTFCIEPYKKNFKSLKRNIKLNKLKNIFALNYAISDFVGKAFFNNGGDSRFGATGGFVTKKKISKLDHPIKTITLDNLVEKFKIKDNFHIKIDIDKDLNILLKGFKNTVKNKNLKSVLIETENIKERTKVFKFFKPYMKILKLEKIVKNHSTTRRKKKKSSRRNFIFYNNSMINSSKHLIF